MRKGGGAQKGAVFERKVCILLSLWVTDGERAEIFVRNVQSGGKFTQAVKINNYERGMPGDVMAGHPMAFAFLQKFAVECKHLRTLNIDEFVFGKNSTMLGKIIQHSEKQSKLAGLHYMVVAKQNHREIITLMPTPIFEIMQGCVKLGTLMHHDFHRRKVTLCYFEDMVKYVDAAEFLAKV
jgi:hypothetical protein